MASLIGLASLLSGLWFLIGMPVVLGIYTYKYLRCRILPTGLLVAAIMLLVFYASGLLLWRQFATHYWQQSLLTALDASGNAAKYGHPVEHAAEVLLVWLVTISALSATAAGVVTAAVWHVWIKHRHMTV